MTDANTPDNIRPGMTGDAAADPATQGHNVGEAFSHTAQQDDKDSHSEKAHTDGTPDESRRPDGGVYPERQPNPQG